MDPDTERRLLTMVDVIAAQVAAMAQPVAAIPPMQRDIAGIRTEMSQGFNRLERRMDGLEHRMDRLEIRMNGLDGRMDRLGTRMDGLGAV